MTWRAISGGPSPEGIVHSTAGYMVGTWSTFKYVFDYKPGEVFWCTAGAYTRPLLSST